MKIIFAKNIGFCGGVKRAVDIARRSLEKDPSPIQFLGGVVHNEEVIREIEEKGGRFVSDPKEVKSGTLVIRAHGTPPFPALKGVFIKDATCPLVKKAQEAAKTLFKEGYRVIIIGEKDHPEVRGIQGYIENKATVVESESEARKIKESKKIGVVAQTTQNMKKIRKILDVLRKRGKEIKFINTVCPEVLSRQKEISELLLKVKALLVIGSPTSANTNQLVKIAKSAKKQVWLANSVEDLKNANLKGVSVLGVVSGTSTPDWVIEKIKRYLMQL
ncbi:MAG: 4-hydroxy-3-methylbut-2-enyl diphosphate reductase [bacterium]|nr:4-hydroxy-3-methylbut-2-enyl diphosphate reductase [bacterium]